MADKVTSWLRGPKTIFSLDYRALAVFRIGLSVLLVYDIVTRAGDALAFYTDFGVLPRDVFVDKFANPFHVSLHLANGKVGWIWFLQAVHAVFALMLLFGFKTRLATVASWVLLISIHNRNPLILNGGDTLLRMLFFWGMFLPLGMKYSVDAALAKDDPPQEPRCFSGASVALVCQVLIVYAATVLLKNGNDWWPDGTASYYALSVDAFTTRLGAWLSQWHGFLRVVTYGVFFLEAAAPLLLICPLFFSWVRAITVFSLIALHVSFDASLRIGMFPYVDAVSLIVLLPTPFWDFVFGRLVTEQRRMLEIRYDGECGFCAKLVRILKTFLLIPETKLAPAQADAEFAAIFERERSWIVRSRDGKDALRFEAFVVILEHSPLVGWLARRLPLRKLAGAGDRVYGWIASSRSRLSHWTAACLPWGVHPRAGGRFSSLVCVFFLVYVVHWNLSTPPQVDVQVRAPWNRVASVLRIDQKWGMFAPYPLRDDGWFVVEGELRDGTKVDVRHGREEAPSYDKPALVSADYKNARWRKYLMHLWKKDKKKYRPYYGQYLCRAWNGDADRPARRKLSKLQVHYMLERTPPPGQPARVKKVTILRHNCL